MNNLAKRIFKKLTNLRVIDRRHLYKYWEQEHLRKFLKQYSVDCVFDIGANFGQYARMLRKDAGYTGRIISFEPNPKALEILKTRAKDDPLWEVEEIAISSADGMQTFNVMLDSEFSSFGTPRHDETDIAKQWNVIQSAIEVKTETLTTAFDRLDVKYNFERPYLKMDTQGYDVEIVMHAGPAIERFIGLQSELAVKKLYDSSVDFRDAISVYESFGFELSAFVPNNGGFFPWMIETDCVMVRSSMARSFTEGQRGPSQA